MEKATKRKDIDIFLSSMNDVNWQKISRDPHLPISFINKYIKKLDIDTVLKVNQKEFSVKQAQKLIRENLERIYKFSNDVWKSYDFEEDFVYEIAEKFTQLSNKNPLLYLIGGVVSRRQLPNKILEKLFEYVGRVDNHQASEWIVYNISSSQKLEYQFILDNYHMIRESYPSWRTFKLIGYDMRKKENSQLRLLMKMNGDL